MFYFKKYFIISLFIFILNSFTLPAYGIETKKNILILNPTSETTYSNSLFEAIRTTLDENSDKYNFSISSLKGAFNKDRLSSVKNLIHSNKIDLIICLDGTSAKILQDNFNILEANIPVLYTTLYEPLKPHPNFTGLYINYDLETYLSEALRLHPTTKKINFLIDIPLKKSIFFTKIEEFIAKYKGKYEFQIIETGNITDIAPKFLGSNTLTILYSTIKTPIKGSDGFRHNSFFGSAKHIASITADPVYGGLKDFTTEFNIGSFNFCGYNVGLKLVNSAISILNGETTQGTLEATEYKEPRTLLINRPLAQSLNIPLNNPNYGYFDFRDTNTILATKQKSLVFILFVSLIVLLCIVITIYFYKRKSYKNNLATELVKTNLMANISHELRTPLNIILSTIQLIPLFIESKKITINDPIVLDRFSYLRKNSLRLLRLVNNIIDFTKIDAGFSTANKGIYNLVEIVEDITLSSVDYATKNNITLTFDTTSEELFANFDKDQIERITLNLLSNALKFTPPGGDIFVNITENADDIYVSIKDTGVGISPKDLSVIFDRFRQAEDNLFHKNEGSGLGLSLCKSMINLNDGSIFVESVPSKGSTFTFSLKKHIGIPLSTSLEQDIKEKITIEYSDFIIND